MSGELSLVLLRPFGRLALRKNSLFGSHVITLFDICGSDLGVQFPPKLDHITDYFVKSAFTASMLFQEFVLPEELRDEDWNDPAIRDQVYALAIDVVKELWPTLKERFRVTV